MNYLLFLSKYKYPFLLLLATFICYFNVLDNTWRYDDGFHLFYAISYSPWEYFFKPEITALHTTSNVTPFNPFFYDITMYFFGLDTIYYYAHIILLISVASVSSYLLLRLWMDELSSFFASFFFILGGSTVYVTHTLMTGHYAYGIIFFIWSLYFFVTGLRKDKTIYFIGSAIFYLLSVTCKELYVPLVALIIFLPERRFRTRLKSALPHIMVAIFYIYWRHLVLGEFIGRYSPENSTMITNILLSLKDYPKIIISIFGDYKFSNYIIYFTIAVTIVALFKGSIKIFLFSIFCFSLVVLPTLPVAHMAVYQGRFYFIIFWALSVMIVFSFRKVFNNVLFILFMSGFLILFAHNNYKTQKGIDEHSYEHDLSTKFVVDNYDKNELGIYTNDDYDFLLVLLRDTYFKFYNVKSNFVVTKNYEEIAELRKTHKFYVFDPVDKDIKTVNGYLLDSLKNNYELNLFKDVNFEGAIYLSGIKVEDVIRNEGDKYTFSTFYYLGNEKKLHSEHILRIPRIYFQNVIKSMNYSFVIQEDKKIQYALKNPLNFEKSSKGFYSSTGSSIDAGAKITETINIPIKAENLNCNIERPSSLENIIQVKKPFQTFFSGWSLLDNSKKQSMDIFLYLTSYEDNQSGYLLRAFRTQRPDVTGDFRNKNYIYSGFFTASGFNNIPTGMYKMSIVQKYKNEYYQCPNIIGIRIIE